MTRRRGRRSARPWHLYLFALVAIVILALAISEIGAPASSARTSKEIVTAEDGVVQTTVSGTGNVEPGVDDAVNFATSGTLKTVDVTVGDHVKKGQLIATLDPAAAELTLEEADDSLTSAQDDLTSAEDGDSTSSGSGTSGSSASSASGGEATATAASVGHDGGTVTTTTGTTTGTKGTKGTTKTNTDAGKSTTGSTKSTKQTTPATKTVTTTKSTPSPAQIAQAESSVDSAEANVASAEKALADTKLYAPVSGTIASLSSDEIGQTVSSGSTSSGSAGGDAAATTDSAASSSSSSSGFATIIDNKTMTMSVSLSETDISSVKVGQIATVSLSALSGVELGGKVTSISPLGSSSDGVVSYDVGLTIYQYNPKVLPGMSATATIVTGQAQGVTLPTEAVSGDSVDLDTNGKITRQSVTVGLKGASREIIASGLKAGQEVQVTITLPALGTSTSSSSSSTTSRFGSGGFGGAAGGFGAGGGARAFFGGGGA